MSLHKLPSNSAWYITDLDDETVAFGPVTLGPRVMQVNGRLYARAETYKLALAQVQAQGAAAGIKVDTSAREEAVAGFVSEVGEATEAGRFHPDPGFGVGVEDLAPLAGSDPRNPLVHQQRNEAHTASVVATAMAALEGDPAGRTIVAHGMNPVARAAIDRLLTAGARCVGVIQRGSASLDPEGLSSLDELPGDRPVDEVMATPADLVLVSGGLRAVTHESAGYGARHLVPIGDQLVTPRAIAELRRSGTSVWPDILSGLGPTLAGAAGPDADTDEVMADIETRVGEIADASRGPEEGPAFGACLLAEDFMRGWREELPVSRPFP